jgi:hypothetical protein
VIISKKFEISSNKIFGQKFFSKNENINFIIVLYSDRCCDKLRGFSEISSKKIKTKCFFSENEDAAAAMKLKKFEK